MVWKNKNAYDVPLARLFHESGWAQRNADIWLIPLSSEGAAEKGSHPVPAHGKNHPGRGQKKRIINRKSKAGHLFGKAVFSGMNNHFR